MEIWFMWETREKIILIERKDDEVGVMVPISVGWSCSEIIVFSRNGHYIIFLADLNYWIIWNHENLFLKDKVRVIEELNGKQSNLI